VLLMIQRSPLVMLYKVTIERIWPSRPVEVDAKGLRFANGLGLLLSVVCLVILYFGIPMVGWILTGFFAVFKTVSALGYCPGLKLYDLIRSDK